MVQSYEASPTRADGTSGKELAELLKNLTYFFGVNISVGQRIETVPLHLQHHGRCGSGVAVGEVRASPLAIVNRPIRRRRKYVAYFANQAHELKLDGKAVRARPDEIIFLNSADPWQISFSRPYTLNCVAIENELIEDSLMNREKLISDRLHGSHNLGRLFNNFIRTARSISESSSFEVSAPGVARSFQGLISLAMLTEGGLEETDHVFAMETRRQQVKRYIDTNFSLPELSVAMIAERLRLSPRYIHMAFAAEGIPPCQYLRKRRLEASAQLLRDERWQARSVTDVAFACGFSSSSHFSTLFRHEFGASPLNYRRQAATSDGTGDITMLPQYQP